MPDLISVFDELDSLREEVHERMSRGGTVFDPRFSPKLDRIQQLKGIVKQSAPDMAKDETFKAFDDETTKWWERTKPFADKAKQNAIKQTREDSPFVTSGTEGGGVMQGLLGAGAQLASPVMRAAGRGLSAAGFEDAGQYVEGEADYVQGRSKQLQQAQRENVDDQKYGTVRGFVNRNLPGAVESITEAAALAPVGGFPAMALGFGVTTANDAFYEGKQAGLDDASAAKYGAIQGLLEASVMSAFQGLGKFIPGIQGFEGYFTQAGKRLGKETTGKMVANFGKEVFGELAEENLTTIAQQVNTAMSLPGAQDVMNWTTPGKTGFESFWESPMMQAIRQTSEQTLLTMGIGKAGRMVADRVGGAPASEEMPMIGGETEADESPEEMPVPDVLAGGETEFDAILRKFATTGSRQFDDWPAVREMIEGMLPENMQGLDLNSRKDRHKAAKWIRREILKQAHSELVRKREDERLAPLSGEGGISVGDVRPTEQPAAVESDVLPAGKQESRHEDAEEGRKDREGQQGLLVPSAELKPGVPGGGQAPSPGTSVAKPTKNAADSGQSTKVLYPSDDGPQESAAKTNVPSPFDLGKQGLNWSKQERNRRLTEAGYSNITPQIINEYERGKREATLAHAAAVKQREDERLAPFIESARAEFSPDDFDMEDGAEFEDKIREIASENADRADEEREAQEQSDSIKNREQNDYEVRNEATGRGLQAVEEWAKRNGWDISRQHSSGTNSHYATFSRDDGEQSFTVRVSDHHAPKGSGFNENTQSYHEPPDVNIVLDLPEFDEDFPNMEFSASKHANWEGWTVPLDKLDAKQEELDDERGVQENEPSNPVGVTNALTDKSAGDNTGNLAQEQQNIAGTESQSSTPQGPRKQGRPGELGNVPKTEAPVSGPTAGAETVPATESGVAGGRAESQPAGQRPGKLIVRDVRSGQETVIPEKQPATPPEAGNRPASLSQKVSERLSRGEQIDPKQFWVDADESFGGTRAEGKYGPSEAYDELESGVNQYVRSRGQELSPTGDVADAVEKVKRLEEVEKRIPRQQNRSGNKDVLQQFSTPPAYAFATSWVANVQPGDVVLEPSAGTGSLAVHAQNAGAEVHVNELDPKRRALLGNLSPAGVTGEDAEQIGNILAGKLSPSVVVMNPPFSHAGHRMGTKTIVGTDLKHIDAALSLVRPGGRVVAIVGAGLHGETKAVQNWVRETGKKHSVRANVVVGRDVYKTSGTDFPTRVLVVDKVAPTSGNEVFRGSAANLDEFLRMMEGVRNERGRAESSGSGEQAAAEPSVPEPAAEGGAEAGVDQRGDAVPAATDSVGDRESPGSDTVPAKQEPVRSGSVPERDVAVGPGTSPETTAEPGSDRSGVAGGEVDDDRRTGEAESSGSGGDAGGSTGGLVGGTPADLGERLTTEKAERPRQERREEPAEEEGEAQENIFEQYQTSVSVSGAKPHPASIVESAAMSAVKAPEASGVTLSVPSKVIREGLLSEVQLEAVTYAKMAHEQTLPGGERQGFMIGDGTGVGKGREIAGIILDNFHEGRKRAIWVSKNWKLFKDAQRDWGGLGQNPEMLHRHDKTSGDKPLTQAEGILFTTYGTIKSKTKKGDSRVDQLVKWLGEDFDGVLVFDEAHGMANALDSSDGNGKKASQTAVAGLEIQKKLPNARVVYVSATAATDVANLAYTARLGLWGDGTPFATVKDFVSKIGAGGVAAMEVVARDMKALGKYLARSISFNDGTPEGTVKYERLEHTLTGDQRAMYDRLGDAWRMVYDNLLEALGKVDAGSREKMRATSLFWSAQQRFYSQILVALQAPSVIKAIEKDMDGGRSAVIQLVNTGEAAQERALAGRKDEEDLEDLDLSPRDVLMQYVQNAFPTTQFEEYEDENGNTQTRPVKDANGNNVQNAEAVARRDRLLDELGSINIGNESPIDMIVGHFGADRVAEITGRKQRVVAVRQSDGSTKRVRQDRTEKTRSAEAADFQGGKRRILIFSDAGGTGSSYHADRSAKNQQPRRHYLLQAGWRADAAIQGFGRSHRSNQAQAPTYVLVTTDIKGQKRFISTIARRLSQLGALTKGQSGTGSTGVFRATDNLESRQAKDALRRLFGQIHGGNSVTFPGGAEELSKMTGLKIVDRDGRLLDKLPDVSQFLNRMLSLPIDQQNQLFDEFETIHRQEVERAEREGNADKGVEFFKADKIEKVSDRVARVDPGSGAETRYVKLRVGKRVKPKTWEQVNGPRVSGFVESASGHLYAVETTDQSRMDTDTGSVDKLVRLVGVIDSRLIEERKLSNAQYWSDVARTSAKTRWEKAVEKAPEFAEHDLHLVTGMLLPVWDRFTGQSTAVKRLTTDGGETLLGRVIPEAELDGTLRRLGLDAESGESRSYTVDEVVEGLGNGQTAQLGNGWKLKESRVGGEQRVEILGPSFVNNDEMNRLGVFSERIQSKTRYFVPTGRVKAVLSEIVKTRPVVSLSRGAQSSASKSGGGGGSGSAANKSKEFQQEFDTSDTARSPAMKAAETQVPMVRRIPMPELVELATSLMGKPPQLSKRLRSSLGLFVSAGPMMDIRLKPSLARDPKALAAVLAHEIGHLIDYQPDADLSRGNVLGRVLSLHRFLKDQFGGDAVTNKELRRELIGLSEWWSPYDKSKVGGRYIQYRQSAKELYADALSVLLNAPTEVKRRAPKFFEKWQEHLDKKPEVALALVDLWDALSPDKDITERRRERLRKGFAAGSLAGEQGQAVRDRAREIPFSGLMRMLQQLVLDRYGPLKRRARAQGLEDVERLLSDLYSADNESYLILDKTKRLIHEPLQEAGVTDDDIGEYLVANRIVSEVRQDKVDESGNVLPRGQARWEIANPLGLDQETSQQQLDGLKKKIGDTRYKLLEDKMREWHRDILWPLVAEAERVGVYASETVRDVLEPNRDNYATFAVVRHIDGTVSPGIAKQVGTFEDIGNPFQFTLLKALSLSRLNQLNEAAGVVIKDLLPNTGEVKSVEVPHGAREPVRPAAPGMEHMGHMEDGKLVWYEVPVEVAQSFQGIDLGLLGKIVSKLQRWKYDFFHPLFVTFAPGFLAANPFRDLTRTWHNLGALHGTTARQVLKAWIANLPAASKAARGEHVAQLERMVEDKAFSVPFVDIASQKEDLVPFLPGEKESKFDAWVNESQFFVAKLMRGLRYLSQVQETATKLAGYQLLTEAGVTGRQRAEETRKYVGTPDWKTRGLITGLTDLPQLYSNVKYQANAAAFGLATNPKTAAGWWWRAMLSAVLPTTLMKASLYGSLAYLMGDDWEEWWKMVPDYDRNNTYVIPLPDFLADYLPGAKVRSTGKRRAVYLSIPRDETINFIARLTGHIIDHGIETSGGVSEAKNAADVRSEMFNDVASLGFSGFAPPIEIAVAWESYLAGENPRDKFRRRDIVPRRSFSAGGMQSHQHMLDWTMDHFGVLGRSAKLLSNTVTGLANESKKDQGPLLDEERDFVESLFGGLRDVSGVGRLLKVSDRGASDAEWNAIHRSVAERDQFFMEHITPTIRRATAELSKLQQRPQEQLSAEERLRKKVLNLWHSRVYKKSMDAMRKSGGTDQSAIDQLDKSARSILESKGIPREFAETFVYEATSGLDNVKDSTRWSRLEARAWLKSSGLSKAEQLKALDAHWLAEAQEAENKKAAKSHRPPRKVTTFNRSKAYWDRRRLIQQGM